MAIIVEDGTGKSDAVSLCSVAAADAYHLARSNSAWSDLDPADKESALVRATDYMQAFYRLQWKGMRKTSTQRLDWPRYGVTIPDAQYYGYVLDTIVPEEVVNACAELALRASSGPLAPDLQREVIREKIDVLETWYAPGSQYVRYREIDAMLAPFIAVGGNTIRLVRS
jgi:hypothetical protein